MNYFTNHKIIKDEDGYIIILYLNQQLNEFAKEFDKIPKTDKENLEQGIQNYIKNKLPNIKINTANQLTDDIIYTNQILYLPIQSTLNKHNIVSNPSDILVLVNKNNSLPSDYVPENLVIPNVPFSFEEFNEKKLMRRDAALALEELFKKAKVDNIDLYAVSSYRSYTRQEAIFTSSINKHGIEIANQFSAKAGESEHQTGLAMDITSATVNFYLTQYFGNTKEGKWVKENAADFGFIIRYPKDKEHITGYQYEPWHIRYIGKEDAKNIANQNITLEEYLSKK
ncbi:M15 family metallopeptidase [Clostridium aestuarii]|uniref:M15 family metallopeptidase n=1 Tax=Clostridium aestuarii TaxID=338193 RepID=A0ABT4D2A4_9CLOT|nr:M15 family metallopeptidase [Clostridium aestuarii]MCY6484163.1 M15 family metallopeptidase [Clostridium aestuarii]